MIDITKPMSTARAACYIAVIFGLYALLQWHDEYTERRIAEMEAQQVRTIACDEPVAVASAQK